jgi:hypothetical protein
MIFSFEQRRQIVIETMYAIKNRPVSVVRYTKYGQARHIGTFFEGITVDPSSPVFDDTDHLRNGTVRASTFLSTSAKSSRP